ncbi:hypothetical protein MMA231_01479 [Asticcacaulis sp. MM231]|uniref:esterase-like activity of phytase family protein n=1 Tax=Asticcacaulis sp. MM231 TaxID=3157666 RepID=UPI0032D5973F
MRSCFVIVLALLATSAHAAPQPYLQKPTVSFRALPAVTDPKPLNAKVRYVGCYELNAKGTSELDGLSDFLVLPEGDALKVEAISDFGAIARFALKPDGRGGYLDSPLEIDRLRDGNGKTFQNKMQADSEGLTYDPVSGDRYVSFEGIQRVMKFTGWRSAGETLPLAGLAQLPSNSGMEAVTYVRETDGDSLLIGVESGGFWRCGLVLDRCREIAGPATPGFLYMTTSLAVVAQDETAKSHEVLALYRYFDPFSGPRNVLRLLRLEGNKLTFVADLAKVAPPLPYDNYEGVAAIKTAEGYRIFLVSDGLHDNDKPKILIYDWRR